MRIWHKWVITQLGKGQDLSDFRNRFNVSVCQVSLVSFFFFFVCEAIGNAATLGLLCQPRVIVKMIVEKQMECRLAGGTEVLHLRLCL
jgi:hypothetical protein